MKKRWTNCGTITTLRQQTVLYWQTTVNWSNNITQASKAFLFLPKTDLPRYNAMTQTLTYTTKTWKWYTFLEIILQINSNNNNSNYHPYNSNNNYYYHHCLQGYLPNFPSQEAKGNHFHSHLSTTL